MRYGSLLTFNAMTKGKCCANAATTLNFVQEALIENDLRQLARVGHQKQHAVDVNWSTDSDTDGGEATTLKRRRCNANAVQV